MAQANVYDVDTLREKLSRGPYCSFCGGNETSGHDVSCTGYAVQLARQNSGENCEHCGSSSGHRSYCGLINREAGEAKRIAEGAALPVDDATRLHGLGVKW